MGARLMVFGEERGVAGEADVEGGLGAEGLSGEGLWSRYRVRTASTDRQRQLGRRLTAGRKTTGPRTSTAGKIRSRLGFVSGACGPGGTRVFALIIGLGEEDGRVWLFCGAVKRLSEAPGLGCCLGWCPSEASSLCYLPPDHLRRGGYRDTRHNSPCVEVPCPMWPRHLPWRMPYNPED